MIEIDKLAAIVGAVITYIEQEEQAKAAMPKVITQPSLSPWRLFRLQEVMRARTSWYLRRNKR